ncbi:MAG: hypothetical protein H5U40_11590 [Polyangiaceae bacterium]|nr:hypothetical protein [Polyangiaceae bacterium]
MSASNYAFEVYDSESERGLLFSPNGGQISVEIFDRHNDDRVRMDIDLDDASELARALSRFIEEARERDESGEETEEPNE